MRIVGIIPARYKSSRFPGKPLVEINGKPLVIRVAERVVAALGIENTYIATEDERIMAVCEKYGYQSVMTSDNCKTGTDRLYEASLVIKADIYVNVQGDEPIVEPQDILNIAQAKIAKPGYVINGMCNLEEGENEHDINIPKVITNKFNELIYMSRLAVPGIKDPKLGKPGYKKQVCIYAFSAEDLVRYSSFEEKAEVEWFEDIEILRFFDAETKVLMVETSSKTIAVDIPTDVQKVEAYLNRNNIS